MKNKKKKIVSVLLIALTLFELAAFAIPAIVNAATSGTLSHPKVPDVWYTRRGGGKPYMSAQYETYTMDGKTVYCIEPGVDITTTSYLGYDGFQASPYSPEINKKIELIGHYGYDYPGHQTLRYRMAAQALIWETTGGQIVEFWTKASGWGDYINIDAEKNEIMRLVNSHYNKPSFNGSTQEAVIGKEIKITDTNNVLSEYEVYSSDNLSVRIEGNSIYVTPLKVGVQTLNVVRKHYDNFTTIVYIGNGANSQKMGYFRFSDPVVASVKFDTKGGDVTVNKKDNDTQTNEPQGVEATLEGAVYGIYNLNDELVEKVTTNSEGKVTSPILPDIGTFYLKEISPSTGYELDPNKYYFEITVDDLHPSISVYEQIIKRDVEINKYYASGETGILKPEVGIEFGIYDSKGNHVTTVKTDEQGYSKINLVYGTYTVKQLNTTEGHEKVKDFKIIVNGNSPQTIRYSLSNAPITAKLKLVKIDSESGKVIPFQNVTFKIKNVDTGEYVCQKVTYPNKEEICEFKTDKNGVFITPYPLMSGTYQIEEITSPDGYLLNQDGVVFRIDENSTIIEDEEYGKYIEIKFANDKIMGEVVIEKTGEAFTIEDGNFSYNDIKLSGVEFSIYANEDITTLDGITHYKKGEFIKSIKTGKDGIAKFSDLYLGKYLIKETKTLDGYVIDTTEHLIELTAIDNKTAIVSEGLKLKNELKKGDLEFTKTDLVNGEPIPNTVIEVYTEDTNELIFTGTTDENGKIIIKGLVAGKKYYILEKESATGYLITDEKVSFEIKENGEVVKAEMKNKPITGTLEFTKVDFSTGTPLPDTLIEIYNDKDELIFSGRTDENGMIIIKELRYGRYYILEKEAPEGYILNEERMYFEIREDGEIVKATMKNEKVVVEVPNTGINDYHIIEIVGGLLIISGIGVVAYVKKKRKQQ